MVWYGMVWYGMVWYGMAWYVWVMDACMHIKIIIIIIMIIIIYYYHNQYYHYYYRCIYTHLQISYIHVHTWKSQHRCIEILVSACSEVTLLILLPAGGKWSSEEAHTKIESFRRVWTSAKERCYVNPASCPPASFLGWCKCSKTAPV
jgi:amino acid transporter